MWLLTSEFNSFLIINSVTLSWLSLSAEIFTIYQVYWQDLEWTGSICRYYTGPSFWQRRSVRRRKDDGGSHLGSRRQRVLGYKVLVSASRPWRSRTSSIILTTCHQILVSWAQMLQNHHSIWISPALLVLCLCINQSFGGTRSRTTGSEKCFCLKGP